MSRTLSPRIFGFHQSNQPPPSASGMPSLSPGNSATSSSGCQHRKHRRLDNLRTLIISNNELTTINFYSSHPSTTTTKGPSIYDVYKPFGYFDPLTCVPKIYTEIG